MSDDSILATWCTCLQLQPYIVSVMRVQRQRRLDDVWTSSNLSEELISDVIHALSKRGLKYTIVRIQKIEKDLQRHNTCVTVTVFVTDYFLTRL